MKAKARRVAGWVVKAAAAGAVMMPAACASPQHRVVDLALSTAHRPQMAPPKAEKQGLPKPEFQLLAGDLHCHVSPPDHPSHVDRSLAETQALARAEKLDFVVLTPHVWARFYESEELRARVLGQQAALREGIAALPSGGPLFIPGIEYTDGQYGHVGVSFTDIGAILAALPIAEARAHPGKFFERHVAAGGLLVVNHPFTTPVNFVVSIARADLSWRPFLQEGPFPEEIETIGRLAQGYEAFNLTTTNLRDRFLLLDTDYSIRRTLQRLDTEIPRQHRRMAPVGGSDSHSHHLRATTFVLAKDRSLDGIREGLVNGRTCIRDPGACSFRARASGGTWVPVGGVVEGVEAVEVAAEGADVEVLAQGEVAAKPREGKTAWVTVRKDTCTVLRAHVGLGESAAIYVNCGIR